ncbi:MAG: radical SAM protein, partial [Nitrospinota bacterium]
SLKRGFDSKPMQCSMYVTDHCNLDCRYCTEYDNSRPQPDVVEVKKWVKHVRQLGVTRVAFVGGEPLMHPGIVEIVGYANSLGLATSLTTNGFLLTETLVADFEEAGLDVIQISVDRMTPSRVTKKSVKSVEKKIGFLQNSKIKFHITGVICEDTFEESKEVLDYGLARSISTEVRIVHSDPDHTMRVEPASKQKQKELLLSMKERKRNGEKIHSSEMALEYQLDLINGDDTENRWVCATGYKLFFVSASGKFMECSMRPPERDILSMTLGDLKAYHRKKPCQRGCGVYCAVSTSLYLKKPFLFLGKEAISRVTGQFGF